MVSFYNVFLTCNETASVQDVICKGNLSSFLIYLSSSSLFSLFPLFWIKYWHKHFILLYLDYVYLMLSFWFILKISLILFSCHHSHITMLLFHFSAHIQHIRQVAGLLFQTVFYFIYGHKYFIFFSFCRCGSCWNWSWLRWNKFVSFPDVEHKIHPSFPVIFSIFCVWINFRSLSTNKLHWSWEWLNKSVCKTWAFFV